MTKKLTFTSQTYEDIETLLSKTKPEKTILNFLNAYSIYLFRKNKNFYDALTNQKTKNINFVDSIIVSLFLSIKNLKIRHRVRGPDFTESLFNNKKLLKNKKHFFIGFNDFDINFILNKYSFLKKELVRAYNPPYIKGDKFSGPEIEKMIKMINKHKPDYLWVGIGNPKQEILANQLYDKVNFDFAFSVGAGFDFISEKKKRAPKLIQTIGIEWLYRLITDFKYSRRKFLRSLLSLLYITNTVK